MSLASKSSLSFSRPFASLIPASHTLAALKKDPSEPKADRSDKASIELWAEAFRNVPAKTFTFRSSSMRLPMSVSAVGTPLVPVRIGEKLYNFWLDTGSSLTMLASDVARDLNVLPLVSDTLEIVTSTGRVKAQPSLIPQLQIGQVVVQNAPTMIVDETLMRMSEPRPIERSQPVKIDGIIGFDIIRQLDLEVDYGESILRLRNPASSRPESDRNMFWVGLPVIRLESGDGIALHFALDTGAQQTFVTETLLTNCSSKQRALRAVGSAGWAVKSPCARRCCLTCGSGCADTRYSSVAPLSERLSIRFSPPSTGCWEGTCGTAESSEST